MLLALEAFVAEILMTYDDRYLTQTAFQFMVESSMSSRAMADRGSLGFSDISSVPV